jgi:hypothetical protein
MAATDASPRVDFGAGQLFLADSRLAFGVLNHVRVRALQRMFGISREQANLLTLVLLLAGTETALTTAGRVVKAPLRISRTDAAIGGFAMRQAAMRASGPGAAEISPFGTLMTIAVLGGLAMPTLRRSMRRVREIENRVRLGRQRQYASARRAVGSRLG